MYSFSCIPKAYGTTKVLSTGLAGLEHEEVTLRERLGRMLRHVHVPASISKVTFLLSYVIIRLLTRTTRFWNAVGGYDKRRKIGGHNSHAGRWSFLQIASF